MVMGCLLYTSKTTDNDAVEQHPPAGRKDATFKRHDAFTVHDQAAGGDGVDDGWRPRPELQHVAIFQQERN